MQHIPVDRLWVNPDCGLKTRQWEEVTPALIRLVEAAQALRESLQNPIENSEQANAAPYQRK
ncbi:MAG: hypothetical protein KZQ77_03650, partial [Candidatus Thiodiazotropha sp. (ex Notomyrtea botanica)]|nr:hypothetical protein [Candidatus Thiodiazotropha sp. (ex Notomyrtea botanica)]